MLMRREGFYGLCQLRYESGPRKESGRSQSVSLGAENLFGRYVHRELKGYFGASAPIGIVLAEQKRTSRTSPARSIRHKPWF